MSEKIITAHRTLVCDLCGYLIPCGSQCRMVRDDFQRDLIRFEHLRCPGAPAVVMKAAPPKPPRKFQNQNALCFA